MGSVPGGRRGDGAAVAGAADRVASAASELYGADPQEFTDRRKALAAAAKDAGDTKAAKTIAALRKPTRAAWVVNSLARADPGAADRLAALAASLRAAGQAKDGRRLRELSAERGSLIDALTGQALTAAGVTDAPAGLREEVTATLTSALADREVAAAFAAGTLTKAAQWAGFGFGLPEVAPEDTGAPPAPEDTGAAPTPADSAPAGTEATGAEVGAEVGDAVADDAEAAGAKAGAKAGGGTRGRARGKAATAEVTQLDEARRRKERRAEEARIARQAEEERRLAEEAAQAAARRRQVFEDAERAVATAATVAMDAVAAEDRLEREVRDLEDRVTRVRAQLADARLRARRAETAERKARQTLARLPRPEDSD